MLGSQYVSRNGFSDSSRIVLEDVVDACQHVVCDDDIERHVNLKSGERVVPPRAEPCPILASLGVSITAISTFMLIT